jgi:hypothetical protein
MRVDEYVGQGPGRAAHELGLVLAAPAVKSAYHAFVAAGLRAPDEGAGIDSCGARCG